MSRKMPLNWHELEDMRPDPAAGADEPRDERGAYRFKHRLQVRFSDCDPMRHANHAAYLTFCEQARFAYWRRLVGVVEHAVRSFIIARAECDYKSPALPGEWLDIWLGVDSIGRSSFPMSYEIVSGEDGRLVATARTVQVMFDYGAAKSFPVPEELASTLERFEGRALRGSAPDSRTPNPDSDKPRPARSR